MYVNLDSYNKELYDYVDNFDKWKVTRIVLETPRTQFYKSWVMCKSITVTSIPLGQIPGQIPG